MRDPTLGCRNAESQRQAGAGAAAVHGTGHGAGTECEDNSFRQWARLHALVFIVEREKRRVKKGAVPPEELVGSRVRIRHGDKDEAEWRPAEVGGYDEDNYQHHVQYDDGLEGWWDMSELTFTVEVTKAERDAAEEAERRAKEEEEARKKENEEAAQARKKLKRKKRHKHKKKKH